MIEEARRRLYLGAMQVVNWLPRTVLPFAAPSRPEWQAEPVVELAEDRVADAPPVPAPVVTPPQAEVRTRVEVPRPSQAPPVAPVAETVATEPSSEPLVKAPPPRFALQLLRAGACALLVELPNGEPFTRRDPAYMLLKDLLRAAGLPDSPQLLGEPVRWPLLTRGSLDQGPQAAQDFVQSFVATQLEGQEPCACLWLVGLPAVRFAGERDAQAYNLELQIDGLGSAWALPGLELLMDEPQRKAPLWTAMRRLMPRWKTTE